MKVTRTISTILTIVLLSTLCYVTPIYAEEDKQVIRVCAVGDNIAHGRIIKSGLQDDGTRDYSGMYRYYKEYLKDFDLCVVNQETVFVEDEKDFSSYPRFGGPEEIGLALIDSGFNAFTTATNHVLDKGLEGLDYYHYFWIRWGFDPVGTYTDKQYYDIDTGKYINTRLICYDIDDIKIGLLNYTYGTNGLTIPGEFTWQVATLDDKETVKKEIQYANKYCDVVIVFPHWGIEYQYKPSKYQKEWAQLFADNGADVIVGTHPHVIQPLEYIIAEDEREVPCYYSLGNFVANQDEVPRMLGAAAIFNIVKDSDGVRIEDVYAVPNIIHISCYSEYFYAKQLLDYTTEEESDHRMRRIKGNAFSIDNLWNLWYSVFSEEQTGKFVH